MQKSKTASNKEDKYVVMRREIRQIYEENYHCYGYRRIHIALKNKGIILSEKVIRRIMIEDHLFVYQSKHRKYNSYQGEISSKVANILNRNFKAEAPNKKWITDISEFAFPA